MRKFALLLMLCIGLSACLSEEASIDGRWVGTITEAERTDLKIEGERPDGKFVIVFEPGQIHMNDTVRPAEYLSNRGRTLVHFQDENRAMTIYHQEDDPDTIRLSAVSYFRNDVHNFILHRVTE